MTIAPPVSILRSTTVPTCLLEAYRKKATGTLTLQQNPIAKVVHFSRGSIVFASSNDRDDRLNHTMLRRGMVTLPDLMEALEVSLSTRQRLGKVLVAQGKLHAEDVATALQEQIKGIVYGLFNWTSGSWLFEKKPAVIAEETTLHIHPLELVLRGIGHIHSWTRAYEVVGGLNTEYLTTKDAADIADQVHLTRPERQLLKFCGAARTLREICHEVPIAHYSLCNLVWGLVVIGALMKS